MCTTAGGGPPQATLSSLRGDILLAVVHYGRRIQVKITQREDRESRLGAPSRLWAALLPAIHSLSWRVPQNPHPKSQTSLWGSGAAGKQRHCGA